MLEDTRQKYFEWRKEISSALGTLSLKVIWLYFTVYCCSALYLTSYIHYCNLHSHVCSFTISLLCMPLIAKYITKYLTPKFLNIASKLYYVTE